MTVNHVIQSLLVGFLVAVVIWLALTIVGLPSYPWAVVIGLIVFLIYLLSGR